MNAAFMAGDSGGLSIRFFLPPVLGVRSFLSREKPLRLPAFARHPIFHGDKDFSPRFLPPRSIPGGPKKKIPRSGPAFSGAGRLRVDYLTVKDFGEGVTDEVKGRLASLTPSRNTRMGAAVRHASAMLSARPSRVKLLIILSDGFPNDLEYKGNYAIADTRRAIREARAKNISDKSFEQSAQVN